MDSISKNLQATEALLAALEQDPSLLDNANFIKQLTILRKKHEDTTNYLARRVGAPQISTVTQRSTSASRLRYDSDYYPPSYPSVSIATPSGFLSTSMTKVRSTVPTVPLMSTSQVVEESFLDGSAQSTTREIPTIVDMVMEEPKPLKKSKSVSNLGPTIPKPFQLTLRKNIENTYAKRFMNEMMEKKKQQEQAENAETLENRKFKAKPVPKTTYNPDNKYMNDGKYVACMREKVARATEKKFKEQNESLARSKSEGNLYLASLKPAGYIPPSTYISPIPVKPNARHRSSTKRAAKMIVEASTPKGIKSHRATSNLTHHLRHDKCGIEKAALGYFRRNSPPDFEKLHAQMDDSIRKAATKPSTVPIPFKFAHRSPNAIFRHINCKEENVQQYKKDAPRAQSGSAPMRIPTTHGTQLRDELIRKRIKAGKVVENGNEVWKEDNRRRIASFLGRRSKTDEDIAVRTKLKIEQQQETTREYIRQLAEMKQRVLNGPLIMEKQSALAQEHRLKKKFAERMKNMKSLEFKNEKKKEETPRRNSHASSATYVVEYHDDDFEEESDTKKVSESSSESSSSSEEEESESSSDDS